MQVTDRQAATPFGYCPSTSFLSVGHIARLPDETVAKILTASPLENWRRLLGRPRTMWMKTTVQQDLKSNSLSMNETDVAQNRPRWRLMSTSGATQS